MADEVPRAPRGLRAGGKRLWSNIAGEYELSPDEYEVLTEACRTRDELDAITSAIRSGTPTVTGPRGQVVANPLLAEARAHRAVLGRLLKALGNADENQQPESWTTIRAREAAQARWRAEREAERLHRHA